MKRNDRKTEVGAFTQKTTTLSTYQPLPQIYRLGQHFPILSQTRRSPLTPRPMHRWGRSVRHCQDTIHAPRLHATMQSSTCLYAIVDGFHDQRWGETSLPTWCSGTCRGVPGCRSYIPWGNDRGRTRAPHLSCSGPATKSAHMLGAVISSGLASSSPIRIPCTLPVVSQPQRLLT
jgi:hypothetical protein